MSVPEVESVCPEQARGAQAGRSGVIELRPAAVDVIADLGQRFGGQPMGDRSSLLIKRAAQMSK
jgi:hypothetical protein